MAIGKINPNSPIVNGGATICPTAGNQGVNTYDRGSQSQQIAGTTSGITLFDMMDGRYLTEQWSEFHHGDVASSGWYGTAASGVDATVYLPAQNGRHHVVLGFAWSYLGVPVGGTVQIESPSGTVLFAADVTNNGAGFYDFDEGFKCPVGRDLLIRAKDGSTNKKLSLAGHRME